MAALTAGDALVESDAPRVAVTEADGDTDVSAVELNDGRPDDDIMPDADAAAGEPVVDIDDSALTDGERLTEGLAVGNIEVSGDGDGEPVSETLADFFAEADSAPVADGTRELDGGAVMDALDAGERLPDALIVGDAEPRGDGDSVPVSETVADILAEADSAPDADGAREADGGAVIDALDAGERLPDTLAVGDAEPRCVALELPHTVAFAVAVRGALMLKLCAGDLLVVASADCEPHADGVGVAPPAVGVARPLELAQPDALTVAVSITAEGVAAPTEGEDESDGDELADLLPAGDADARGDCVTPLALKRADADIEPDGAPVAEAPRDGECDPVGVAESEGDDDDDADDAGDAEGCGDGVTPLGVGALEAETEVEGDGVAVVQRDTEGEPVAVPLAV